MDGLDLARSGRRITASSGARASRLTTGSGDIGRPLDTSIVHSPEGAGISATASVKLTATSQTSSEPLVPEAVRRYASTPAPPVLSLGSPARRVLSCRSPARRVLSRPTPAPPTPPVPRPPGGSLPLPGQLVLPGQPSSPSQPEDLASAGPGSPVATPRCHQAKSPCRSASDCRRRASSRRYRCSTESGRFRSSAMVRPASASGGQGNQASGPPAQPWAGESSHGIGARHPSRPPGSRRRPSGTSASSSPSSSPA